MERERDNGERKRERRENEEISLHFLSLFLFPQSLSIFSLSLHFLILSPFPLQFLVRSLFPRHFLAGHLPACRKFCHPVSNVYPKKF